MSWIPVDYSFTMEFTSINKEGRMEKELDIHVYIIER